MHRTYRCSDCNNTVVLAEVDAGLAVECECTTVPLTEEFHREEPATIEGYLRGEDSWELQ